MIEERKNKFIKGKNIFDLQQQVYEDTLKDARNNNNNNTNDTNNNSDFLYKLTDKLTNKIRQQLKQEIRENNLISNNNIDNINDNNIKEKMENYLQKEVIKNSNINKMTKKYYKYSK